MAPTSSCENVISDLRNALKRQRKTVIFDRQWEGSEVKDGRFSPFYLENKEAPSRHISSLRLFALLFSFWLFDLEFVSFQPCSNLCMDYWNPFWKIISLIHLSCPACLLTPFRPAHLLLKRYNNSSLVR